MQTITVLYFHALFPCLNSIDALQIHGWKKQFYFANSGFTYASKHTVPFAIHGNMASELKNKAKKSATSEIITQEQHVT